MHLVPGFWWYVTRSSAMVAWVLLVFSVMLGIFLSTRVLRPRDNPSWLLDLHRWVSGLSVVFVGLHMASLYIDTFAHFSIPDLLVPFHSKYTKVAQLGAVPIALGVMCFYFMIAVQFTSVLMKVLPRRFWKAIHYLSYVTVLLVSFHAGWSGTDVGALAYRVVAYTMVGLTTILLVIRILQPKSARTLAATVEKRRPAQRSGETTSMVASTVRAIAQDILMVEFVLPDRSTLKPWVPGSHITLHLDDGMTRQYSLCGDPADRAQYQIAVQRAPQSRGGSQWIHDQLRVGTQVEVSGPHNHFELEPSGGYLFIAGGIGITPIKSMVESLPSRRDWRLLYLGRDRLTMAFADELAREYPDRVTVHADNERGGRADLAAFIAQSDAPIYVCGPEPLLAAIKELVPAERLHYERFAAVARTDEMVASDVEVTLQRSGKTFTVPADTSLLTALNQHGAAIVSSCGEGVCGTCEVRVLQGRPWHRDSVTSDEDKDEISVMYPCVSRSRTPSLTLDL